MPIYSASGNLIKLIGADFGAIGQELHGHDTSPGCEYAYFRFLLYYMANGRLPIDRAKLKRIGGLTRLPEELGKPDVILDEFLEMDSLTLVPAKVDKETGEVLEEEYYRQDLWQAFINGAVDSYDRKMKQTEPGRMAAAAARMVKQAQAG